MYKLIPCLLILLIPILTQADVNKSQFDIKFDQFEIQGNLQQLIEQNKPHIIQKFKDSDNKYPAYLFDESLYTMTKDKDSVTKKPIGKMININIKHKANPRFLVEKDKKFTLHSGSLFQKVAAQPLNKEKVFGYEFTGIVSNLNENILIKDFYAFIYKAIPTTMNQTYKPDVSHKLQFFNDDLKLQNKKPYTLFIIVNESKICAIEITVKRVKLLD